MSRVHSTSISFGIKLVSSLKSQLKFIDDLDEFLNWDMKEEGALMPEGVFIADREMMQKRETIDYAGLYPHFILFKRKGEELERRLVEINGQCPPLDTRCASAARQDMRNFKNGNRRFLPEPFENAIPHFRCFSSKRQVSHSSWIQKEHPQRIPRAGDEFFELAELNYFAHP